MPASESTSAASNLHESIEQLIAESMRKSRSAHEAEKAQLTAALSAALGEIEVSQQALSRAAKAIRTALNGENEPAAEVSVAEAVSEPADDRPMPPAEEPVPVEVRATPTSDRGPHELDVIAHGVSFSTASGLQSFLRERAEVESAQTREFVNGELRLQLALLSGLDMDALRTWLAEHDGELVTTTDSVIEVRFGN